MWKLHAPTPQLIQWYESTLLEGLYNRIKTKTDKNGDIILDVTTQQVLIPNNQDGTEDKSILQQLLTLPPIELHRLCENLMSQLIINYDENELEAFLNAKAKKNRNDSETEIYDKYNPILTKLCKVFDYEGQISSNKSRSYNLTLAQGFNTCTYCNRQYVFTVGGTNDASRIARPELDHWYSKELFPLMSLNIYNLIPSCSICNSTAKGNTIFRLSTHIHPYLFSKDEPDFRFRYKLTPEHKWTIVLDKLDDVKEQNMVTAFKLDKLYHYHGELEVKDILLFKYQNSNSYLEFLLKDLLSKYQYTKHDIYRMVFCSELDKSNNLNRPFSKLKRDILIQLGIIKEDSTGFRFLD